MNMGTLTSQKICWGAWHMKATSQKALIQTFRLGTVMGRTMKGVREMAMRPVMPVLLVQRS